MAVLLKSTFGVLRIQTPVVPGSLRGNHCAQQNLPRLKTLRGSGGCTNSHSWHLESDYRRRPVRCAGTIATFTRTSELTSEDITHTTSVCIKMSVLVTQRTVMCTATQTNYQQHIQANRLCHDDRQHMMACAQRQLKQQLTQQTTDNTTTKNKNTNTSPRPE